MSIDTSVNGRPLADSLFASGRFIYNALSTPAAALAYRVGEELAVRFSGQGIIESDDPDFDVEAFARAGLCALRRHESHHVEQQTRWAVEEATIFESYKQGWFRVGWEGVELELLCLSFPTSCGEATVRWLIADTLELAERFFAVVSAWNSKVEESILVFQDGYWQKSRPLYEAIQRATFDNLILGGSLKADLHRDLAMFFGAREIYARSGVPWKRGIVLIGPPGNGKTHAVKALINALGQPCLYVKSFSAEHVDDHYNIRAVFAKARQTAPCMLVLEDLDSLITDHNRSFFLNELDGFADNEGIVTIASTNHPDKLDPAIMARPSRFDRKYHFGLPGIEERVAYLNLWHDGLDDEMRPSAATLARIASDTDGFSFAYIKELLVASTVRWAEAQKAGTMDAVMPAELAALRAQMSSAGMF